MSAPFVHRLRVRWSECDPQGIVFNAHYLAFFDLALTELWREDDRQLHGDARARPRHGRREASLASTTRRASTTSSRSA